MYQCNCQESLFNNLVKDQKDKIIFSQKLNNNSKTIIYMIFISIALLLIYFLKK